MTTPATTSSRPRALASTCALALLVLLMTLPWAMPASAQRLTEIFDEANAAVFAGDADAAITGYDRLIAAGVVDADVSYNLAVAHGRAGHYGQSIRWFERSLAEAPGNDDAEAGLTEVRAALGRRQAARDGEAWIENKPPFAEALVRPFSRTTLGAVVLVLEILFFGLLVLFARTRHENRRLAYGITAPLLAVCLGAAVFGVAVKAGLLADGEAAIVVTEDAAVREGPHPQAEERATAREGERAYIVGRDGVWVQLHLPGGRRGWVREDDVGAL